MAMHIVTSCTTDDSTRSLEDVRRLKKSLDRQRALTTDSPLQRFQSSLITIEK